MAMHIGTIRIKLHLPQPHSLKEKRAIIKRLLAQARREFNVSIAEIGALDDYRKAELGAALVSNDGGLNSRALTKLVEFLERDPQVFVEDYQLELL